MQIILSGVVDQRVHFYTGVSGLASGATVRRKRGGNASAAMTTPDIVEDPSVVGAYGLLADEDMTITSGKSSEAMTFYISHASLANPIAVQINLVDALRADLTKINGSPVAGSGTPGDKWTGV